MSKLDTTYSFYEAFQWLTGKALELAPVGLDEVAGTTAHYDLPDFRLNWHGIRIVGIFPRPKAVQLLLECRKFLDRRDLDPADEIDAFEEARGALPLLKNGLVVLRSAEDVDEEYLDVYLRLGMDLLLREIRRRHPGKE